MQVPPHTSARSLRRWTVLTMWLLKFLSTMKQCFMQVQRNLRGKRLAKSRAAIGDVVVFKGSTTNGGRSSPIRNDGSFKVCERKKKRPSGRSVFVSLLVCACVCVRVFVSMGFLFVSSYRKRPVGRSKIYFSNCCY